MPEIACVGLNADVLTGHSVERLANSLNRLREKWLLMFVRYRTYIPDRWKTIRTRIGIIKPMKRTVQEHSAGQLKIPPTLRPNRPPRSITAIRDPESTLTAIHRDEKP
jgi:hypothetical protein